MRSITGVTNGDEDVWTVAGPRAERRGYWQAQVDAHRRSRQSQAAFCAQRGLRKGTFRFWKWKLKQGAGAGAHEPPATVTPPFIPVRIPAPAVQRAVEPAPATRDGVEVELTLGLGRCLRVRSPVEPMWLVQVGEADAFGGERKGRDDAEDQS